MQNGIRLECRAAIETELGFNLDAETADGGPVM